MTTPQENHHEIDRLPAESLADLVDYLALLCAKTDISSSTPTTDTTQEKIPLRIVNLRGLLSGYDFSPELLRKTRREMVS